MDARTRDLAVATDRRALITCTDLRHAYASDRGRTVALDGVTLAIGAGEFVCVLGPSGCGKTTLLNVLAGFVAPGGGEVRIAGAPVRGPGAGCGVVFQDYSLFPWLTAQGNVEFGLRMMAWPKARRGAAARELLELVGLPEAAGRYPFELSGGMKQRVAIARALATRPAVLLMDEPFAALDAMTRNSLQARLIAIQQHHAQTVLFVTHNIAEAITLASRLIVMSANPGRIIRDIAVDLPRPRRRTSVAFNALYEEVAAAIGLAAAE